MKRSRSRILCWILVLAMALSILPPVAFAAEGTAQWKQIAFEAISPEATVAITMTKGETTYVLPTVGEGGSKQPLAYVATMTGETLQTPGSAGNFGWNITPTEGGYFITAGGKYLYVTATNNGVRVGNTQSVWTLVNGYLSAQDSKETPRYLGVFEGETPDWRCYTRTDTNIAGQEIGFWVLEGETTDPTVPTETDPTVPSETDPSETEPSETTEAPKAEDMRVIAANVGGVYYAMANTFGSKISGAEITVTNGTVAGADAGDYAVCMTAVEGGYTISANGKYLAYKSGTNLAAGTDPYVWSVSDGINGSKRITSVAEKARGLVFRAGTYNQFGGYAVSNAEAGSTEYFDVEILTIVGEIGPGSGGNTDPTTPPEPQCNKPKANPPAGYIARGTEVAFTCSTKGSTVLYHTGDGNWVEYTDPIAVYEDVVFTLKGQAPGMLDSPEVPVAYTVFTVGEQDAVLVTDISELASGDKIIIVAQGYNFALGAEQRNNNRGLGNVIKTGNTCTYDSATQILTLEAGTTDDTYALYTGEGYLYAPTDSGNYLRTNEDKIDDASFYISIAEDGVATITANTAKLQSTLFYNTSKLFSLYNPEKPQKPICIYKLSGQERPGIPENGDTVVLYNLTARGVLSAAGGSGVKTVKAELVKGEADCTNGAFLFTVEHSDNGYRFMNEAFGYLCAKNNALYYSPVAETEADWTVETHNGGYKILSSDGKLILGQTSGAKLGDMGTDRDAATFYFYPCNNTVLTEGVVNMPEISFGNPSPAYAGQDYILHFTANAVFGVKEVKATLAGSELEISQSYGRYAISIPADMIAGASLEIFVKGMDNKGVAMEASVIVEVKDEPMISNMRPVANSQTMENKRPEISAKVANAGIDPTITLTVNGQEVAATYENGVVSYKPTSDMADGRTVVILTVTRQDGKTATKKWSFTVGEAKYSLLFGQLHAHTGEYSDGAGTLAGALEYIAGLPENANVDFVAFTDHSNYFDTSDAPNVEDALYDLDLCTPYSAERWTTYKSVLAQFNKEHEGQLLLIPGFEMTWSGGPGHINTFVTEGIVSRNNKTLNNKSADAGMRAYYELLTREEGEEGISQFNHPGTTFGNFTDFSYWNPQIDSRMYLVEVGNGEGPVRGSGYFPSYEQYTMALDKGWHVAPTNNQDNHKGKWGNANEARDVVLAEDFTEEALYDAIRNYRVYATEDRNLEILYAVNELPMGTIMENVPETLNFNISVKDPDAEDTITSVELIVNSGKVAYTWDDPAELANGVFNVELDPDYSYYYVRVIQADKDIAVTAPVWVGESLKLGIREAKVDTDIAIVGEEVSIQTTFYNEEQADAIVKNIVYTTNGSQVLYVDNEVHLISAGSDVEIPFIYTPEMAKFASITITATLEYEEKEYTFTASVDVDAVEKRDVTYMGIDAAHLNEYVTGKYAQMMGNFTTLATEANIRTRQLNSSAALIEACKDENMSAIVLNVPSRQLAQARVYSDEEIAALKAFNERGGILIISNLGDKYDKIEPHMAATQNVLLEGLGSSLRFADDAVREGSYNSVYAYCFGPDELTNGLEDSVVFYNGSSVYAVDGNGQVVDTLPEAVSPVLFGNYKTEARDEDNDGLGNGAVMQYTYDDPKYGAQSRLLLMAAERMEGRGMIFVSGVPFMNDYNVLFPAENGNNALAQNLLKAVNPIRITEISEVRQQSEVGYKYNIEGVVTSNASGYDKDTAFFDCIYVQDETAGINCFPVAGDYKIGDVVQIKGRTEFYIGEPELQVQTITKIGEAEPIKPVEVTATQLNNRSVEGTLITLKGTITKITMANGLIESIYIIDREGVVGRAFIDGYITADKAMTGVEVGREVSATGIGSYDNTYAIEHDSYARIRVRDRDDIITSAHVHNVATVQGKAPTCTEPGLTEGEVCTICNMVLTEQQEIPATGHTAVVFGEVVIPTCTEPGMTQGEKCSVCGEILKEQEVVPATGHNFEGNTCDCGLEFPFADVPENEWYREAVEYVFTNGLMNGMNASTYAPDKTLTRAMLITILYRMAGTPEVRLTNIFTDVETNEWYTEAIQWGYDNGIVKGVSADRFAPNLAVTREQMVTFLYRYAAYANYDLSKAETTDLSDFVDASRITDYAQEAFRWAVGEGIVNGFGKNNLKPQGTATRAQVAQIIMKFHRMGN